ncbi:alpha/beta hydrolase (plasmid) [Rhizobium sp. CC1099]|uniref:alpha/beta fold hydrolase n=1 Tax=Rhizobium sp. CC1099 TaxID=3039160 RepID=UPI0024B11D52|nr:alpha/beta hydrolase [Rhizobium sp. CC1099]WFU91864.1 alpha/beta hydrolase [Rhizobium sp. CC1099]
MPYFRTKDGTQIYYKDWGKGQPVVFSHGWPLSSDAWDSQMQFLASNGCRVIAHDRRSHGRSDQTWEGNNMDQYVADYAEILAHLDVQNAVLVGHSTGGGEVAHYIGKHGTKRVAKAVLVSSVPPLMLKTEKNPNGTPIAVFDGIRKSVLEDRSQFYKDLTMAFFGFNRPGATVSEGVRESFWLQGMLGGVKGQYDCIHEFSEIDYTDDLRQMTIPTLVIHGDDDQIVPIKAAGIRSAEIAPNATLKIYKGAPHGLPITRHDDLNHDLLAFIRG